MQMKPREKEKGFQYIADAISDTPTGQTIIKGLQKKMLIEEMRQDPLVQCSYRELSIYIDRLKIEARDNLAKLTEQDREALAELNADLQRKPGKPKKIFSVADQVESWGLNQKMTEAEFQELTSHPIFKDRLSKKCNEAYEFYNKPSANRNAELEISSPEQLEEYYLVKIRSMPRNDKDGKPNAPNYYLGEKPFSNFLTDLVRATGGNGNPWVDWTRRTKHYVPSAFWSNYKDRVYVNDSTDWDNALFGIDATREE
jgi:hypothetical protein